MKKIARIVLFIFVWCFYVAIICGICGIKGTLVYILIFGLTEVTVSFLMSAFGSENKKETPRNRNSDNGSGQQRISSKEYAGSAYSKYERGCQQIERESTRKVAQSKSANKVWKVRAFVATLCIVPIVLLFIEMYNAQSDGLYELPVGGSTLRTERDSSTESETAEHIVVEEAAARHRDSICQQEKLERELYKDNHLKNGAKPYRAYYGKDRTGDNYMDFKTDKGCDYVVIVKRCSDMRVMNHVYIRGGRTCRLYLPDGMFNVYFYSGTGWNPNKKLGRVKGGFMFAECKQKDEGIELNDSYVTYTLYAIPNGNLQLQLSSESETF